MPSDALGNAHFGTRSGHGFGPRLPVLPTSARTASPTALGTVSTITELLDLTIVFEPDEEGWIVASIPKLPGVHSQGKTREEARENVIDALRDVLALRFGEHPSVGNTADSETLQLVIA